MENRNLDGVYFRVKREGEWKNVCFSDLTDGEIVEVIGDRKPEWWKSLAMEMRRVVRAIGDMMDIVGGDVDKEKDERGPGSKVSEDLIIDMMDTVGSAAVYIGSMACLQPVKVKTRVVGECDGTAIEELTLKEIADQVLKEHGFHIITVITDRPLEGEIYEYGNYGDYWIMKGHHMGYA